ADQTTQASTAVSSAAEEATATARTVAGAADELTQAIAEISARAGERLFVVEADEYDTAFFDKRAKFVHYRPAVAVLNNLEFDHADIFPDLAAIETQFNHFLRTIPGNGCVVVNAQDPNLARVLERGCWSQTRSFGIEGECTADWRVELLHPSGSELRFYRDETVLGDLRWPLTGRHNALNACAAIAAAERAGANPAAALDALAGFRGVRRRLEFLGERDGISVYDDFAHHPTAIRLTLEGLRRKLGGTRLLVALQPGSNTMRAGHHFDQLAPALAAADAVFMHSTEPLDWDPSEVFSRLQCQGRFRARVDNLLDDLRTTARSGDHLVFMSNRDFGNAPRRFLEEN
ncbi:MAG: Mur ligase family protein, partial [Wenzhouxiangellaceae bacterium]